MKKILFILLAAVSMTSCIESLEFPPKNILNPADIYNENGIRAYMAGLYNRLPMEDFNVVENNRGSGGYFGWEIIWQDELATGEIVHGNNPGMYYHETAYWSDGYQLIRDANDLLNDLPNYIGQITGAEDWIAEARFIRAYTYFALVKRYGGVPIIKTPQTLVNGDPSSVWVARSAHEDCYDFILDDLDYAIANMSVKKENGRANKYVAAAFKSRVANFAGSIARYGQTYNYTISTIDLSTIDEDTVRLKKVMLCGIPAEKANDYFQQAYDAAKIVEEGGYDLYQKDAEPDKNFSNIFVNADSSPESIFIRQYLTNNYTHSFDAIYSPGGGRFSSTYGGRFGVTLDWVELFDGLPIDPATGRLKTTNASNNYIVYDSPTALFANAEPRLKGSLLLPMDVFKGVQVDMRRGVLIEQVDPSTPIAKFVLDDGSTTTAYGGAWFIPADRARIRTTTEKYTEQIPYDYVRAPGDTVKINKNGLDGPANSNGSGDAYTGFLGRKWLDPNLTPSTTKLHTSTQSWIDIRYAEVLLNRAEAALELAQNGVTTYAETDMQTDAFECINKIRTRAGATLLSSPADLSTEGSFARGGGPGSFVWAPNRGMQLLRVERYKELAFEHKLYWDLRRWFSFDRQIYNYRRRMINPFLFAKGASLNEYGNPVGKYIYDTRVCERANNALTFATKYYYEGIPSAELKNNPLLIQNNQR
ncbi:MAG: RagB/SusD family nutrient uptake outer membrane protein [Dysgonamonadaceae bacterium]|jgi:hypothetical protein|nr:RagB/SusD family nutrient uptake outer membrane protein [Dysgonamonadaceae bacterium]